MDKINIEAHEIRVISTEGKQATMSLAALFEKVAPRRMDTGSIVLPDGVKTVISEGPVTIWVHQSPPCVYSFRWISSRSRIKYGAGTEYETVRIALPYLIVFAVFAPGERGLTLSRLNECFFRSSPLESLEDELCYPALLNCSKFVPPDNRPLSWICSQYLDWSFSKEPDQNRRMRAGFRALMRCLLETGFNYSSEHHEASSWFTESRQLDPRISSIEQWQAATNESPLFALDVPWLKTGHTVSQVATRILGYHRVSPQTFTSASALARLVYNHGAPAKTAADVSITHVLAELSL